MKVNDGLGEDWQAFEDGQTLASDLETRAFTPAGSGQPNLRQVSLAITTCKRRFEMNRICFNCFGSFQS